MPTGRLRAPGVHARRAGVDDRRPDRHARVRDSVSREDDFPGRTGQPVVESAHLARDGTVIPTEVIATTIELGGKTAILEIARDLTERRRAEAERIALEQQLRRLRRWRRIGRLAGGIAHDFNNLLTSIRGMASLALAELPPGEGPHEDLEPNRAGRRIVRPG